MMTQVDEMARNLCSVSLSTLSPVGGVLVTQASLSNQALQGPASQISCRSLPGVRIQS